MQAARDLEKEKQGKESATKAKEKLLEDNANLRAKMTEMEKSIDRLKGCLKETRRCVCPPVTYLRPPCLVSLRYLPA